MVIHRWCAGVGGVSVGSHSHSQSRRHLLVLPVTGDMRACTLREGVGNLLVVVVLVEQKRASECGRGGVATDTGKYFDIQANPGGFANCPVGLKDTGFSVINLCHSFMQNLRMSTSTPNGANEVSPK